MTPHLITSRRATVMVIITSAAATLALGLFVHGKRRGTAFDDAVARFLAAHLSSEQLRAALHVTDPVLIVGVIAFVAIAALISRRRDIALLAVLAPSVSTLATELVLKPLAHRTYTTSIDGRLVGGSLAYPSGHETGVTSVVVVLTLLVVTSSLGRRTKTGLLVLLWIVPVVAAVALIGSHYHYPTDTIGALGVATAIPLALALAIDAAFNRVRAEQPPRTPALS